jgi:4-amino-4-deoxy-L-arabinose transferase-like glycosyltransferase
MTLSARSNTPSDRKWLLIIIALAVIVRLIFILGVDFNGDLTGNDTGWYLRTGLALVTNTLDNPVQPGPTYLVYCGLIQLFFPERASAELVLRLLNIGWHVILLVSIYVLGKRYFSPQVGLLAALIIAINPIFVIETGAVLTESIFLGILFGALALYAHQQEQPDLRALVVVGVLLGLAALTRAVLLLFPFMLAAHLVRLHNWRRGLRFSAVLFLAYALTVSTWTFYNLAKWNRFLIGAEGLTAFAWMGVTGIYGSSQTDTALGVEPNEDRDPLFVKGVVDALTQKLPEYISGRVSNLTSAYLQPHNTIYFPGESLKSLVMNFLTADRSWKGLITLVQGDAFWPKLVLYIFHFWALLVGLAGMILNRRFFWQLFPFYAFILYLTVVHSVLFAMPRYLFPVEPLLILFASSATLTLIHALQPHPHAAVGNDTARMVESSQ